MFALFHLFLGLYDTSSIFYVVLLIPTFVPLVLMILLFSTLCIHVSSEERETIFHFLSFNFLFFCFVSGTNFIFNLLYECYSNF